jgi:hypothetical protein
MLDLLKVAAAADAAADYIEAIEAEKNASLEATRRSEIDSLASRYSKATGEAMPDAIRRKLASSDKDVLTFLQSMVEKQAGTVESMGGPSTRNDETAQLTTKEAAAAADQRFLNWVTG